MHGPVAQSFSFRGSCCAEGSWIFVVSPLLADSCVHASDGPGILVVFCVCHFAAYVSSLISCLSSIGRRPETVSIADIGVLRMAPVIIFMAWFCTLDSLLELILQRRSLLPSHIQGLARQDEVR